ncbi:MAG: methyltransferase [Saprospiraceae bacterium]|nr:MAG: methyltransferase [Saprospiraceae bacterium]
MEDAVQTFMGKLRGSVAGETFVKMTLSKAGGKDRQLKNVYVRPVDLKGIRQLSFTLRYATRDEVKNYPPEEAFTWIKLWLGQDFLNGDLFTLQEDVSIQFNKKRKARLFSRPASITQQPSLSHDRPKERLIIGEENPYLHALGITSSEGEVLKSGQKKFRQINKYIEIIDDLLRHHKLPLQPRIVDMGSGKGYLTFALFDHLANQLGLNPNITGIELRPKLVDFCNGLAQECGYNNLRFLAQDINDYPADQIDMLIALHACDIATDIAIAKGIQSQASVIVVAPCCHKQLRKAMHCSNEMQAVLQHGILAERQAELLTDGIRALLLEAHGYTTKVFEFISTEHTPKNVMIVATKGKPNIDALAQIAAIKQQFGIEFHYLERLLSPVV